MKTDKQKTGDLGEDLAEKFLSEQGFQILERNWRWRKAEIDIIAMDGDILVFVEVKTRSSDYFGNPESFVTPQKEQLMSDAASVYMEQVNHTWEIRFDIISVLIKDKKTEITHFPDAFFPRL